MNRSAPITYAARAAAADAAGALDRLRAEVVGRHPLRPLDPTEYAIGHALFEARSNQRERLAGWLVSHLTGRATESTRVLSIGCGDGSVDVQVARALAAGGCSVDYLGVEPHGPSAQAFASQMMAVPGVDSAVLTGLFSEVRPEGRYDVVLAVHSLYYVADLATTLRRAIGLLSPGGELVILQAPREPLNVLVQLLAPGHPQGFSDEVASQLAALGQIPEIVRIDCRLDLTETGEPETDRRLLEFTVQARVPAKLLRPVRMALAERALDEPGLVLTHPVDALVLRA